MKTTYISPKVRQHVRSRDTEYISARRSSSVFTPHCIDSLSIPTSKSTFELQTCSSFGVEYGACRANFQSTFGGAQARRNQNENRNFCRRNRIKGFAIRAETVAPEETVVSRTQRIMESLPLEAGSGGAGGLSTYEALKRTDANWLRLRTMKTGTAAGPAPETVLRSAGRWTASGLARPDSEVYDVAVCGGTLGVFVATALAMRGKKVAIIERGELRGRAQEWNISRKELSELVEVGVLSEEEAEACIAVEFNPNRCGFHGGEDVWVENVLNLGVSPAKLIETVKQRFLSLGGIVLEKVGLSKVDVFDDGAVLALDGREPLVSRLVIDAMGNFSPIVRQIRWGLKPDGVCLVVGGCARGFSNNVTSDIIVTVSPMKKIGSSPSQYFWEAFPAGSGPTDRTTYLFTYLDANPERPSLEELMEDYWDLMPAYQGVNLEDLQFQRVLFGFFPTYRNSPLPASFDRVLQVGDASGIQSPLSFGGFGSITRHLARLTAGLMEALDADLVNKDKLSLINPYQPNLSGAWLLQRAMSAQVGTNPSPNFINELLSTNFGAMQRLGDPVLRPFLQDVTQFGPLATTMGSMMISRPDLLPSIISAVGLVPLLDWLVHFVGLGSYTVLASAIGPSLRPWVESLPPDERFEWRRRLEAWEFGAGLDYKL